MSAPELISTNVVFLVEGPDLEHRFGFRILDDFMDVNEFETIVRSHIDDAIANLRLYMRERQ